MYLLKVIRRYYLNRREQKMFIVFIRYINYYSLIFLFPIQVLECEKMSAKWNYTLHEYYYVYGVFYSRMKSK